MVIELTNISKQKLKLSHSYGSYKTALAIDDIEINNIQNIISFIENIKNQTPDRNY